MLWLLSKVFVSNKRIYNLRNRHWVCFSASYIRPLSHLIFQISLLILFIFSIFEVVSFRKLSNSGVLWNQIFIAVILGAQNWVLSWTKKFILLFRIQINIIPRLYPGLPRGIFYPWVRQNFVRISDFSHACYLSRPWHPPSLNHLQHFPVLYVNHLSVLQVLFSVFRRGNNRKNWESNVCYQLISVMIYWCTNFFIMISVHSIDWGERFWLYVSVFF
jgi:hypothetical protein